MNTKIGPLFFFGALLVSRTLLGATSVYSTQVVYIDSTDTPIDDVVVLTDTPDEPFVILGKVTALKRGIGSNRCLNCAEEFPRKITKKLIAEAKRMGADALVGLQNGEFTGMNQGGTYYTALAINRRIHPEIVASKDFMICILPVSTGLEKKADHDEFDRRIRIAARWEMELRGYYTVAPEGVETVANIEAFNSIDQSRLESICGSEVGRFLFIEIASKDGSKLSLRGAIRTRNRTDKQSGIAGVGAAPPLGAASVAIDTLLLGAIGAVGNVIAQVATSKIASVSKATSNLLFDVEEIRTGGECCGNWSKQRAKEMKRRAKAAAKAAEATK